jgi:cysteine desulfurase
VLRALGMPDSEARATLRIGIGRFTSPRDIDTAADLLAEAWRRTVSSAVEQVSAE